MVHRAPDRRQGAVEVVEPEPPLRQLPLAAQQREPQLHDLRDDEEGRLGGVVGDRADQALQLPDADVLLVRRHLGELDDRLGRAGVSAAAEPCSRLVDVVRIPRPSATPGRGATRGSPASATGASGCSTCAGPAQQPGPGQGQQPGQRRGQRRDGERGLGSPGVHGRRRRPPTPRSPRG